MEDIQSGHAEDPRGQTIVINEAFIEDVGMQGVRRWVEILVEAQSYAVDHSDDEVEALLRSRVEGTALARPEPSYAITAGLLRQNRGELAVILHDGTVLTGRADATTQRHRPDVRGTEDPSDPHRPLYS